jgi:hypothetical protein
MVMIWLILALTLTQTYGYDLVDTNFSAEFNGKNAYKSDLKNILLAAWGLMFEMVRARINQIITISLC